MGNSKPFKQQMGTSNIKKTIDKHHKILNNDFYIFFLIILLIIMLFMLSCSVKNNFNVNFSQLKLTKNNNNNESFEEQKFPPYSITKISKASKNPLYFILTLKREIVEDLYIKQNDIIKLYDNQSVIDEDVKFQKNEFYFKIDKVEFDEKKNFKLTISDINFTEYLKLNSSEFKINNYFKDHENTDMKVKVVGNQSKDSILSNNITLTNITNGAEEIKCDLTLKLTNDNAPPAIDHNINQNLKKNFKEDDYIKLKLSNNTGSKINEFIFKIDSINDIDGGSITFKLTNNDQKDANKYTINYTSNDLIFITKYNTDDILEDFYDKQLDYNKKYLLTKNKIENYKHILNNIKEQQEEEN
jgi:hypothetical protein